MMFSSLKWGLTVAVACGLATSAVAEDKKKDAEQKAIEELGKPGKEHAHLRRLVGRWDCTITAFFPDPSKPTKTKGSAVFRSLLGGRYVQQNFKGTMEGKPFTGVGLSGYDRIQKKFVGTWIDSFSTGIMHNEGKYDPKTQTLTEIGTGVTPMGEMKFKMTSKYHSNDKFVFSMFMVAGGNEQQIMQIEYNRSAKKGKRKDKKK